MNTPLKVVIILVISVLLVSSGYAVLQTEQSSHQTPSPTKEQEKQQSPDTVSPVLSFLTGDTMGAAGSIVTITASFSDNQGVTSAKLYYKPATAVAWSSKSILQGAASLSLPPDSNESWYYYITIDDAAGNGPIGDPSTDGSIYYSIMVMNQPDDSSDDNDTHNDEHNNPQNYSRFVFIELGTKIVCSECPKISLLLQELYTSEDLPFYYVSLPLDNPKALARLDEYNIWGYPTVYIDGGYHVLIGSNVQKSAFEDNITSAAQRITPEIRITTTAHWDNNTNGITVNVQIKNHESFAYTGRLRLYITEIISTTWQAGTPEGFSFLDFLVNEDIQIPANEESILTKTFNASGLDPENLMLFSVLFNSEKNPGFSQPPDKNPFDAHYVDAVNATRVVQSGNLPPEVGIQNPSVKYVHRFGKPIRKSLSGKTIVLGKTTIVAFASDDFAIVKVEFYIDNKLMATVTQEPYEWTWHRFSLGKRIITIMAYDDTGKTSTATISVLALML
jgi:hypothetical protein